MLDNSRVKYCIEYEIWTAFSETLTFKIPSVMPRPPENMAWSPWTFQTAFCELAHLFTTGMKWEIFESYWFCHFLKWSSTKSFNTIVSIIIVHCKIHSVEYFSNISFPANMIWWLVVSKWRNDKDCMPTEKLQSEALPYMESNYQFVELDIPSTLSGGGHRFRRFYLKMVSTEFGSFVLKVHALL